MKLMKIKLGKLIDLVELKNSDEKLTLENVRGISTQKFFMETKANMDGVPLKGYRIVPPKCFAYVPDTSRRGDKISLAYNDSDEYYLVSSISVVFKVTSEALSPDYLFMFFNRPEFDRYSRYNSFGSAREPFNWSDMCDIDFELPPIEVQKKYVKIYKNIVDNQKNYENGLDDLKIVCNSFIDKIKNKNCLPLSNFIDVRNQKNSDGLLSQINLKGISENNRFMETTALVSDKDLLKYLIIHKNCFAVNFMCLGNFGKFYIAYNDSEIDYLVSPACSEIYIKDDSKINPYYLMALLIRDEFQRKCVVLGDGNTRGGINFDIFSNITVPCVDENTQKIVADMYIVIENREIINEHLKAQIKNLCPILIKGAIKEAEEQ